jgi:hypothetical protein
MGAEAILPRFHISEYTCQSSESFPESHEDLWIGRIILAGGMENTSDIILIDLMKAIQKTAYAAHPSINE